MFDAALRVGRIAYTNVTPIELAFDCGAVVRDAVVTSGPPNVLNEMLSAGQLDVSPVSAAHFLSHGNELDIFGDCAIVARGRVISVVLVSSKPPALLDHASIAVTRDSASGRALLECVLRGRYGACASFEQVTDTRTAALAGRPTLLIGDAAVHIYDLVPASWIYDLGTAWFDWTALPMVFAVWAVRRKIAAQRLADVRRLMRAYTQARDWGSANRDAVIKAAMVQRPRDYDFYDTYFSTLKYELNAPARAGLTRFASEIAKLEAAHVAG